MGCGASTGKAEGNTAIEFKETGAKGVDEFFNRAKEIVDDVTQLESGLTDEKDKFYAATGFEFAPGA
jgi:leucyl-tRNA synthetase